MTHGARAHHPPVCKLVTACTALCWLAVAPVDAQFEPPPQEHYLAFNKIDYRAHLSTTAWAPPAGNQMVSSALTVEAWVHWDGRKMMELDFVSDRDQNLLCGQGAFGFWFQERFGWWTFFLETDAEYDDAVRFTLPEGVWTHLAATYNGALIRIFVDGTEVKQTDHTGLVVAGPATQPTARSLCCNGCGVPSGEAGRSAPEGSFELGTGYGFEGGVREVRLWNRALSQAELAANATVRLTGTEAGLVGYWPLDDGPGPFEAQNLVAAGGPMTFDVLWRRYLPSWRLTEPYFAVREDLVDDLYDDANYALVSGMDVVDHRGGGGELGVVLNPSGGCCFRDELPHRALRQQVDGRLAVDTDSILFRAPPSANVIHENAVADLNGDGLDDVFVGAFGEDFCPDTGARNTPLLSGLDRRLEGRRDLMLGRPCTRQTPAFPGQQPCTLGLANDDPRYPDLAAPLEAIARNDGFVHAVGDIDGDTDLDLWVSQGGAGWTPYFLLNDGNGTLTADWQRGPGAYYGAEEGLGPAMFGGVLADLDGDEAVDLVVSPFSRGEAEPWYGGIFWNDGAGNFSDGSRLPILPTPGIPPVRWDQPYQEGAMAAVDIDLDGDLDLVLGWNGGTFMYSGREPRPGSLQVLVNRGSRTFVDETVVRVGEPPQDAVHTGWTKRILVDDVNGDGCDDLVLHPYDIDGTFPPAHEGSWLWLNDCHGRFTPVDNAVLGRAGGEGVPFDLEPDGDVDFLMTRPVRQLFELECLPDEAPAGTDYHDFTVLENVRPLPTPGASAWIAGECPTEMTLSISAVTPGGQLAIAQSATPGSFTIPGGVCAGTEVGLVAPKLLAQVPAGSDGRFVVTTPVPAGACGTIHLQVLDLTTCETTEVVPIPAAEPPAS